MVEAVLFMVVWGLAEAVQALRKKAFLQRIRGAAIFSAIIVFFTMVGSSTNDKLWVVYTSALVGSIAISGSAYAIRYGLRRMTTKGIQ